MPKYRRYVFGDFTGYLLDPRFTDTSHDLVAIRHSSAVSHWSDQHIHSHGESEEYYLLLEGQMDLIIEDEIWTLKPMEMLMVRPTIPHAVIGGIGPIKHFVFRAPAAADWQTQNEMPEFYFVPESQDQREVLKEWGFRCSLRSHQNMNCWLTGIGSARNWSTDFLFAYLDYPTYEEANAGIGARHKLYLHRSSWEYYAVLEGEKTLQIETEMVSVKAGELLEVPPGVKHFMAGRKAPYRGLMFRVPVLLDKETI